MWNWSNVALRSSTCDQCRSVCRTAIADVGYFIAIWPATSGSLVSSDARLSASDDMTGSWPITSATFILMPKKPDNTAQALEALKFFNWAYTDGSKMALDLDYIPLPDNVQKMIRDSWKQNILDANGKSVWK